MEWHEMSMKLHEAIYELNGVEYEEYIKYKERNKRDMSFQLKSK